MKAIAGVVLAGGRSRRFGSDKAVALHRGRPLIDWAIAALKPFAGVILIAGRHYADNLAAPDHPRDGLGPLGGLAGAMRIAAEHGCTHILTLPCDTPDLPPGLLTELCGRPVATYVAGCPVIGIWQTSHLPRLEAYLANDGDLSMRAWCETINADALEGFGEIINVNRRSDLLRFVPDRR